MPPPPVRLRRVVVQVDGAPDTAALRADGLAADLIATAPKGGGWRLDLVIGEDG